MVLLPPLLGWDSRTLQFHLHISLCNQNDSVLQMLANICRNFVRSINLQLYLRNIISHIGKLIDQNVLHRRAVSRA